MRRLESISLSSNGSSFEDIVPTGSSFEDIQPIGSTIDKKAQESQPLRYLAGGALKNITLMPTLFGTIGQGLEAAADAITSDKPFSIDNIKDQFTEAGKTGIDATLNKAGETATKAMTDFIGIDPVARNTANQIADIAGMFMVPFPGAKGSTLEKSATFLAPLVRMGPKGNRLNKEFAVRGATQLAVGGGIDQGVRALVDSPEVPLMFSDQALGGQVQGHSFEDIIPASTAENIQPTEAFGLDEQKAEADRLHEKASNDESWRTAAIVVGSVLAGGMVLKYRKQLATKAEDDVFGGAPEERASQLSDALAIIKAAPTVKEKIKTAGILLRNRGNITFGNQVESDQILIQLAKITGVPDDIVNQLRGQGGVEAYNQFVTMIKHGIMPDGTRTKVSLRDMARQYHTWDAPRQQDFLRYIAAQAEDIQRTKATAKDFLAKVETSEVDLTATQKRGVARISSALKGHEDVLDEETGEVISQTLLTLGDLEKRSQEYSRLITEIRGTSTRERPGLWTNDRTVPTTDSQLKKALGIGEGDAEFQLMNTRLIDYNHAMLIDAAKREVQSQEWVDSIVRSFSRGERVLYIPRQQAVKAPGMWTKIGMRMGLATSSGKTMSTVGNLQKQAIGEGKGVNHPVGPFNSTALYNGEMLEHTNRSVAQMNWMKALLEFEFDADDLMIFKHADDPDYLKVRAAREKELFIKLPEYIGRISHKDKANQFSRMNLEFDGGVKLSDGADDLRNKLISDHKKGLISDDPGSAQNALAQLGLVKDAIVIQRKGDFYLFKVDGTAKHVLEFDNSLINDFAKFNNTFRQLMTIGTTGRLSTFAPISFIYNASIGALNAAIKSEGGLMAASRDAIRVWTDGVKGAVDILVTGVADDMVQLMTHTLETNTGMFKNNPKMLTSFKNRLQARVKRSMMHDFNEKTGSIGAGSQNTNAQNINVSESMGDAVFGINNSYGANVLPEFVRIWDHLNSAFHEGTAYGVALRNLGGTTKGKSANQIRIAKREAADLVGNNKLQGASDMARHLNAAIPFQVLNMYCITSQQALVSLLMQ